MKLEELLRPTTEGQEAPDLSTAKMHTESAPPETIIWRYISLPAFLCLMDDHTLSFRQFYDLRQSDTHEGSIPKGFWESLDDPESKETIEKEYEEG